MAKSELCIKLAKKLRRMRLRMGLTQEEAAGLAKMDVRHYQKFESLKNPQSPRLETLEKLALAVKTTPSKLIDLI